MKKAGICRSMREAGAAQTVRCAVLSFAILAGAVRAQERQVVVFDPPPAPSFKVAVLVTDQAQTYAGRYMQDSERIGIAQGILEEEVATAGFSLVNLDVPDWAGGEERASSAQAIAAARAAGADYLLYGRTTSAQVLASESGSTSAARYARHDRHDIAEYVDLNRPSQSADIRVQILRVSDGAVITARSAASTTTAEVRQGGMPAAIRQVARRAARELVPELETLRREEQRRTKRGIVTLAPPEDD